mmetsp:Transcript_58781/g.167109  ORF Transcript_58781/g.167109 Transcript_58781/m.167109 type:complete len:265 (-) Transcript_58781:1104-1898(-)
MALRILLGVDLVGLDAHLGELLAHPLRVAVPLVHRDLLLHGLPADAVGVVRELLDGLRDDHRDVGLRRLGLEEGDTHPILDDILLVLLEGHDLRLPGASGAGPVHELRRARAQHVVPNHNGVVGQHVGRDDLVQVEMHLRALLVEEEDVDRLLRQPLAEPRNQVLAVAHPDLDVVRETGPLDGVTGDGCVVGIHLHGDDAATPGAQLRGHAGGRVTDVEADLHHQPRPPPRGREHGVEHRALLVPGKLEPELLLFDELLDRSVD